MRTPDIMPMLSPGAHRRPSKGACFMEYASYLAGEAWSDHPACTHPVLAALAREVNDRVRDDVRQGLVSLVPDVVGLKPADQRVGAWISREAALRALHLGSEARQGVAAVGVLHCERFLNGVEGRPGSHLSPLSRWALDVAPLAHAWALEFVARLGHPRVDDFDRHAAPAIAASSVQTIVESPVTAGDEAAARLLAEVIGQCRTWQLPSVVEDAGPAHPEWCPDWRRPAPPATHEGV